MKIYIIGIFILLIVVLWKYFSFLNYFTSSCNKENLFEQESNEENQKEEKIFKEKFSNFKELQINDISLFKRYERYSFDSSKLTFPDFNKNFEIKNLHFSSINDYDLHILRLILYNYNFGRKINLNDAKIYLKKFIRKVIDRYRCELITLHKSKFSDIKKDPFGWLKNFKIAKLETIQKFEKALKTLIKNVEIFKFNESLEIYKSIMFTILLCFTDKLIKLDEINNYNEKEAQEFKCLYNIYYKNINPFLSTKIKNNISHFLYLFVQLLKINSVKKINLLFCINLEVDLCYLTHFKKKIKNIDLKNVLTKKQMYFYNSLFLHYKEILKFSKLIQRKRHLIYLNLNYIWLIKMFSNCNLVFLNLILIPRHVKKINISCKNLYEFKDSLNIEVKNQIFYKLDCFKVRCIILAKNI